MQQEALPVVAAHHAQRVQLLDPFDALGDHGLAERMREVDDRPHDRVVTGAAAQTGDELPVDLDLIERSVPSVISSVIAFGAIS